MPNVVLTHDDVVEDFATLCAGVALGGSVRVRPRAYLGMNASVRESLTIGTDAVVGMGSVVLRDVPDEETWFGTPARVRPGAESSRIDPDFEK
jgi:serine acetyltransferase